MTGLSYREKLAFEDLFEMETGYILDFTNNTFARFVGGIIGIDIYEGVGYTEYCSKANKLRQIWTKEPDNIVGTLMDALLLYYEDSELRKNNSLTEYQKKKISELRAVCQRLIENTSTVELPISKEEVLSTLLEDINRSLSANQPTLALDRLHTFSTKFLRNICIDNGIDVEDDKGNYLPLHSLAGMIKKLYEQDKTFQSQFTLTAIQNSISLFEKYNEIRNNKSFAHDNEVLDTIEASFAVKVMANLIAFIDKIEVYRKKNELTQTEEKGLVLPF